MYAQRAELLGTHFDCVTLRAVDRMAEAVGVAVNLVAPDGWLVLMTTRGELEKMQSAAGPELHWSESARLPDGEERVLALGKRTIRLLGRSELICRAQAGPKGFDFLAQSGALTAARRFILELPDEIGEVAGVSSSHRVVAQDR